MRAPIRSGLNRVAPPASLLGALRTTTVPLLLVDEFWIVRGFNEPAASMVDRAEIEGAALASILPGWDAQGKDLRALDTVVVRSDGTVVPVTAAASPWPTLEGDFSLVALQRNDRAQNAQNKEGVLASWDLDLQTDCFHGSPEFLEMHGAPESPAHYADFLLRVHPDDREYVDAAIRRSCSEGGYIRLDYRIIRPDGSVRQIEDHVEVFVSPEGKGVRLVGMSRDITAGRFEHAELLGKISILNLLQQLAAAANEADEPEALLQFALDRICAVTGWEAGHVWLWTDDTHLASSGIWYLRDENAFARFRELTEKTNFASGSGIPGQVLSAGRPRWFQHIPRDLDARLFLAGMGSLYSVYAMPIFIRQQAVGVMEFHVSRDMQAPDSGIMEALSHACSQISRVLERGLAQEALRNSREQLRALAARLQAVREEERIRISREIHDELGQLLTVLKIDLTLLRQNLSEEAPENTKMKDELLRMERVADTAIESVQRIASELRPMILDKLGFQEAVNWFCRDFSRRTGILCSLNVDPDRSSPDADRATALFRIFQETLTNAARHSRAKNIKVAITESEGSYVLLIEDDGIGIDPRKIENRKSLGLLGMRERAIVLGGDVRIERTPGQGTRITARIPGIGGRL